MTRTIRLLDIRRQENVFDSARTLGSKIKVAMIYGLDTLIIVFTILKVLPPAMSWMVLDANISGDTKQACTGTGACWTYIKLSLIHI